VLTPYFSGSEPVVARSAKYAGTRVFEHEQRAGLDLMRTLSAEQKSRAMIGSVLPRDVLRCGYTCAGAITTARTKIDIELKPDRPDGESKPAIHATRTRGRSFKTSSCRTMST
jgi:Protein of unknown function (DUF3500)